MKNKKLIQENHKQNNKVVNILHTPTPIRAMPK